MNVRIFPGLDFFPPGKPGIVFSEFPGKSGTGNPGRETLIQNNLTIGTEFHEFFFKKK